MDKTVENTNLNSKDNLVHNINEDSMTSKSNTVVVIGVVVGAIFLGTITGFGVNAMSSGKMSGSTTKTEGSEKSSDAKQTAGILDKKTFPDDAEGILREGGFEGEGSFHLERPGGKDQTAYLTSTTVDLNQFVGKKVRVWGQTFDAKKAGWLMDVGYIEVL